MIKSGFEKKIKYLIAWRKNMLGNPRNSQTEVQHSLLQQLNVCAGDLYCLSAMVLNAIDISERLEPCKICLLTAKYLFLFQWYFIFAGPRKKVVYTLPVTFGMGDLPVLSRHFHFFVTEHWTESWDWKSEAWTAGEGEAAHQGLVSTSLFLHVHYLGFVSVWFFPNALVIGRSKGHLIKNVSFKTNPGWQLLIVPWASIAMEFSLFPWGPGEFCLISPGCSKGIAVLWRAPCTRSCWKAKWSWWQLWASGDLVLSKETLPGLLSQDLIKSWKGKWRDLSSSMSSVCSSGASCRKHSSAEDFIWKL